jgi:hypothetical protein
MRAIPTRLRLKRILRLLPEPDPYLVGIDLTFNRSKTALRGPRHHRTVRRETAVVTWTEEFVFIGDVIHIAASVRTPGIETKRLPDRRTATQENSARNLRLRKEGIGVVHINRHGMGYAVGRQFIEPNDRQQIRGDAPRATRKP